MVPPDSSQCSTDSKAASSRRPELPLCAPEQLWSIILTFLRVWVCHPSGTQWKDVFQQWDTFHWAWVSLQEVCSRCISSRGIGTLCSSLVCTGGQTLQTKLFLLTWAPATLNKLLEGLLHHMLTSYRCCMSCCPITTICLNLQFRQYLQVTGLPRCSLGSRQNT